MEHTAAPPRPEDPTILAAAEGFNLKEVHASGRGLTLVVEAIRRRVACPDCGRRSDRVHSRFRRQVKDLPWHGISCRWEMWSRRFVCENSRCRRRIFAERLPGVAAYARRTDRLAQALEALSLALGGEAGARLAAELGLRTSPDTLLRLIRAAPSTPTPTPRVLGVDDWAIRKRHLYGTILYDLERHRPVDLLLGRTPEILASWLKSHPGVEVVSRDRAGAYAEGVTRGAPSAVQVADCWHLLRNLQEAVEGCCVQHHFAFRQPEPEPPLIIDEPPLAPRLSPKHEADLEARRARRQARFDEVWRLNRAGASRRQIGRQVGLSVLTVRKYLAMADGLPQTRRRRSAATLLDPYRAYLRARWQEGCHSAPRLLAELRIRGYAGGLTTVKDGLLQMRRRVDVPHRPRSPREVAWLLIKRTELLRPDEQRRLQSILEHDEQIHRLYDLAQEFCSLVRDRRADLLDDWMARARASPLRQMRAFAAGLERDLAAVRAGLSLPWSQGPVEGAIHRLKLIKRQTYGRGSIAHLRTRLLTSA